MFSLMWRSADQHKVSSAPVCFLFMTRQIVKDGHRRGMDTVSVIVDFRGQSHGHVRTRWSFKTPGFRKDFKAVSVSTLLTV